MSMQALTIWSMALGMIAAPLLARFATFAVRPSAAQGQAVGYHGTVLLLVLIESGMAEHLWPDLGGPGWRAAQVVAGPCCVGLSDLWIRGWLYAPQRDRLMAWALRSSALLLPALGAACLLLPPSSQLPAAAALSVAGGMLTLWLTARAWRLGDSLAPLMAIGCLLTVPALAGLYAIAMHWRGLNLPLQLLFAACAALSNALTGLGLWRRERHEQRVRESGEIASVIDPVTRLRSARSLVTRIMRAQRRRHRSGRDGAVLAILVFGIERLRSEAGTNGLHELYIGVASRIRRQVGTVNIVGRYYEGCFVALIETIPSLPWLRTLALRLAASLRHPLVVTLRSGDRTEITPDISVGVVHLSRPAAAVEDILADAQRMASAAHAMPSRVAVRDPRTGHPMPIEEARFGAARRDTKLLRPAS